MSYRFAGLIQQIAEITVLAVYLAGQGNGLVCRQQR